MQKNVNRNVFIAEGTKLKIDRFEDINGGQTGKYYGKIQPDW